MANNSGQRFIQLEGCFNFRDLGGYATGDRRTVRWGRLFRSDAMHFMTPDDLGYLQNDLGVVTVLDLRNSEEVQQDGLGAIGESTLRYRNLSLFWKHCIFPLKPGEDDVARLTDE